MINAIFRFIRIIISLVASVARITRTLMLLLNGCFLSRSFIASIVAFAAIAALPTMLPSLAQTTNSNELAEKLIAASEAGDFVEVVHLISLGANVNYINRHREFPLSAAAYGGHANIVHYLLMKGAVPDPNGNPGGHALIPATLRGHLAAVKILVNQGADINGYTCQGLAPLSAALLDAADIEVVRYLLENGADPNFPDAYGETPLSIAIRKGYINIARLLLGYGADANLYNSVLGEFPLTIAVKNGDLAMTKLLLTYGADPYLADDSGFSPLDCAREIGLKDIIQTLKFTVIQ